MNLLNHGATRAPSCFNTATDVQQSSGIAVPYLSRFYKVLRPNLRGLGESQVEFRTARKDVTDLISAAIRTTPVQGYIGCYHAISQINLTQGLNAICCPTLVIVGADDVATPVEFARESQGAMPGAELEIIPNAGHLSNIENPDALKNHCSIFFRRH